MNQNKLNNNKKIILVLIVLTIVFAVFGGTLAYLNWGTEESQKTAINITLPDLFECNIDVGGAIENTQYTLAPASCTDPQYAIQRTMSIDTILYGNNNDVLMDLWIDIENLGTGLSESQNFKYALTTSQTSCTEGIIKSGTFNGLNTGQQTNSIFNKLYEETTSETYYLYIWLDEAETSSSTMNQSFGLKVNGTCTNTPKK